MADEFMELPFYADTTSSMDTGDKAVQEDFLDKYEHKLTKGLHYAHVNINGIKSKFEEIKSLLNNEKGIIFLAVTETKLDSTRDHKNMFVIKNYHDVRIDREEKEGGGTIMYVHHSCEFEVVDLAFSIPYLIECNILKLMKKGMKPVYMCIVYLPPDRICADFFDFFSQLAHFFSTSER